MKTSRHALAGGRDRGEERARSSDPVLEVRGLSVHHGPLRVLSDVDLTVRPGETVAVIGPNGSGKSTLLRAICGLVDVDGDVLWRGSDLTAVAAHDRSSLGIALVPQDRHVFGSLSIEQNLRMGARVRRKGPWDLDAIYELFPLLERARKRPAAAVSAGEQQAVAIGRALMTNPELLLLDEVSLGLPPIVVSQLYDTLAGVIESRATVVLVEQDVGRALDCADRLYCLLEGRVSLTGRPAELGRDELRAAYFGT